MDEKYEDFIKEINDKMQKAEEPERFLLQNMIRMVMDKLSNNEWESKDIDRFCKDVKTSAEIYNSMKQEEKRKTDYTAIYNEIKKTDVMDEIKKVFAESFLIDESEDDV